MRLTFVLFSVGVLLVACGEDDPRAVGSDAGLADADVASDAPRGTDAAVAVDATAPDAAVPAADAGVVAPGSGDACGDAVVVSSLPFVVVGNTAVLADDFAAQGCAGVPDGTGAGVPDGVFEFVAPETGFVRASLSAASGFDAVLYVAEDCEGLASTCLAGANANGSGAPESVTFEVAAGGSYFVFVDGVGIGASSVYAVHFDAVGPAPGLECTLAGANCEASVGVSLGEAAFGYDHVFAGELRSVGAGDLHVTDVRISATTNVTSATVAYATPAAIEVGSADAFELTIQPTSTGPFSVELTIVSDDADRPELTVTATGVGFFLAPDIELRRAVGTLVPDGSIDDIGPRAVGTDYNQLYPWVHNTGPGRLENLEATVANVTGALAGPPFVNIDLDTPVGFIPAGSRRTLAMEFELATTGPFSFDLELASNDPDESPYVVTVIGTAHPFVEVERSPDIAVPDGDTMGITDVTVVEDVCTVAGIHMDIVLGDETERSDVALSLTSPDGTSLTIASPDPGSTDFLSVVRLPDGFAAEDDLGVLRGESAQGAWSLTVADVVPGGRPVRLDYVRLRVMCEL